MEDPRARFNTPADAHTLRVLVATDNHLGVHEGDPIRNGDSFETMEEILKIGRECNVDMVVLGGDLFHINKPTRTTMTKSIELFRKYCFGERDVNLVVRGKFAREGPPNFEDEYMSIDMPVFIIHGNHDDPARDDAISNPLSAINTLSEAGLVNYFGVAEKVDDIIVEPILIEKGMAKMKLYGLGWVRDERLHRMFAQDKVKFRTWAASSTSNDTSTDSAESERAAGKFDRAWFNMFMVHQNRDMKGRGAKNCFQEEMIPSFMDLVVFGHEHECLIEPVEAIKNENIQLCQPGSSVATSLIEGESVEKKVGILEVKLDPAQLLPTFEMTGIPLRTVRSFVMDSVTLASIPHLNQADGDNSTSDSHLNDFDNESDELLTVFLEEIIDKMIEEAKLKHKALNPQITQRELAKYKPLVRLRVEHTGFRPINLQRFGVKYVNTVANPSDMIHFFRKRRTLDDKSTRNDQMDALAERAAQLSEEKDLSPQARISALADAILDANPDYLSIVPYRELSDSIRDYVDKSDTRIIEFYVDQLLEEHQDRLQNEYNQNQDDDISKLEEKMANLTKQRNTAAAEKQQKELEEEQQAIERRVRKNSDSFDMANSSDEGSDITNNNRGTRAKKVAAALVKPTARRTSKARQPSSGDTKRTPRKSTAAAKAAKKRSSTKVKLHDTSDEASSSDFGGVLSDSPAPQPSKRTRSMQSRPKRSATKHKPVHVDLSDSDSDNSIY
mmetsp:Transcript_22350/g.39615  ORF Transcript_22350/g.39615 Transcript_22350/m.39615 type:complete len:728 (+) Transcript_22350:56-2239(+)